MQLECPTFKRNNRSVLYSISTCDSVDSPIQNLLADLLEYGLNPNKKQKPSEDKTDKPTDKGKVDSSSSSSVKTGSRSKLVKRPGRPKGGRRK